MGKAKISVIVPVYNVEEYIGKAIESMLEQTFTDWEMYLVDDGTPDRSGVICDEYAARDERIHVIHQENGGAPAARNHAIPLTEGKYLYFMDADDWCERNMLEDMYELAEANDAQYVVCGYYIDTYAGIYENGEAECISTKMVPPKTMVYECAKDFRADAHMYFDRNLLYTPWNKLYLASEIKDNGLEFPATQWDDFPFNLSVIRHVERVVVSANCYYHFLRARSESESEKYIPRLYEKREEEHGWMLKLYRDWNRTTNPGITKVWAVREFVSRRYLERLFGCFENLVNPRADERSGGKIRRRIEAMIYKPRVDAALRWARPGSVYMKLMFLPLRWKSVGLLYLQAKVISYVKMHYVKSFAWLKAHR